MIEIAIYCGLWIGTAMKMVEIIVFGNGFWILCIYEKFTSKGYKEI